VLFQAGWFASVLGAAHDHPWAGPAVLLAVIAADLAGSDRRRAEIALLLSAAVLGFAFDTLVAAGGWFHPRPQLWPAPFSPPWLVALWVNLAATLNGSLAWLKGRWGLAAALGAVGGPAAYFGGARLGAAEFPPGAAPLLVLSAGWLLLTPLLVWMAAFFRRET